MCFGTGYKSKDSVRSKEQLSVGFQQHITVPILQILVALLPLAGLVEKSSVAHKETQPTRLKQDESNVRLITETVSSWRNPFDV